MVFNEIKAFGSESSPFRPADQTLYSQFWNSSTTSYFWNRIALYLGAERHMTLLQNALVLAALNVATADAGRMLGRKLPLRFLAAHHRDPTGRHGR